MMAVTANAGANLTAIAAGVRRKRLTIFSNFVQTVECCADGCGG